MSCDYQAFLDKGRSAAARGLSAGDAARELWDAMAEELVPDEHHPAAARFWEGYWRERLEGPADAG